LAVNLESFSGTAHLTVMERMIFGAVLGAVLGYAWHRVVGCSSGACPLTANPYVSTFYGAALGALMARPH
jgi:NhaP-type Na+/H+ or K+/H+ antiporter